MREEQSGLNYTIDKLYKRSSFKTKNSCVCGYDF